MRRTYLIASLALSLLLGAYSQAERDPPQFSLPAAAANQKVPLVVLLHAFKVTGKFQKHYFELGRLARQKQFALLIPGTIKDSRGHRFWNAMDYCCNHEKIPVDDVGYLTQLIKQTILENPIDPKRVYLIGHSNGAMMAHRLACDHADLFAAMVSLAGSGMRELSQCSPSSPVSILEIHAKNDSTVLYDGMTAVSLAKRLSKKELYPYSADSSIVRYPPITETIQDWAQKNGCDPTQTIDLGTRHYMINAPFSKVIRTAYKKGCKNNSEVQLWTLNRGGHVPRFTPGFARDWVEFLLSKQK